VAAWSKELTRQSGDAVADGGPLLDLLILVRTTLRAQGAWSLADSIRDRLAELGIALEDTQRETEWRPS
jgi:cysteinyl-tRNA synthetase